MTNWIPVANEATLHEKGSMVVRHEGKQIALFISNDRLFAIDNRCPHEGYPLQQGTLEAKTCVLTCQWHNWKFDLQTGKALIGEDQVQTYATRIVDGQVELDITAPDPELMRERFTRGLITAAYKGRFGQITREVARLEVSGLGATEALKTILNDAVDKLEYGISHAWPATTDWLRIYDDAGEDVEQRVIAMAEAIDHIADDTLREDTYAYPNQAIPFDGNAFVAAVEAQDEAQAIGMVRGGLAAGMTFAHFKPWLAQATMAHYLGFGHCAIYMVKTEELINRLGDDLLESCMLALVRRLLMSAREDLIPEFRAYGIQLEQKPLQWGDGSLPPEIKDPHGLSVKAALGWVADALAVAAPEAVYQRLLGALARNMIFLDLGYDQAYHNAVRHNVGWLDVSHGITFANAVRQISEAFPQYWYQGLLQMACFLGRNSHYQDLALDDAPFRVSDLEEVREATLAKVTDHGLSEPIFSCHLLKTRQAVLDEAARTDDETRAWLLTGLNRFFNSPLKEKHVRRLTRQALDLVSH